MSKFVIPVEKLPPPDEFGNHLVRFRLVSNDKNSFSQWSTIYKVKSLGQWRPTTSTVKSVNDSTNNILSLTWDTPTVYNVGGTTITHNHSQNYKQHPTDIFIQWNGSGYYEFHDRVNTDTTSIITTGHIGHTAKIIGIISVYGVQKYKVTNGYAASFVENTLAPLKIFQYTGTV